MSNCSFKILFQSNTINQNKMNIKRLFTAFTLKALLIITFITVGFAGLTKCEAQTIIGKWHRGGTKVFVTDKTNGTQKPLPARQQKQFDDAAIANGYNETLEFKSNNTYISKVSAKGMAPKERTEKYSLSGINSI